MMHISSASTLLLAIAAGFAGFIISLGYFMILHRTVAYFAAGRGWLVPAALTLCRIIAITMFLVAAAKFGAAALLSAFLGFLFARAVSLRVVRAG